MKALKEHRVPLCARALAILADLKPATEASSDQKQFLFKGVRPGKPLGKTAMDMRLRHRNSNVTVHGFRSTFRDWAAERTNFPSEVVEMALAHAVGSKVEAAYRRGDLFEKRRRLMDAWEEFCDSALAERKNVVSLRGKPHKPSPERAGQQ
jgi:integrase